MIKKILTSIIFGFVFVSNAFPQWVLDYQFLPYPTYMNSISAVDTNIIWVSGMDTSGSFIFRKTPSGWTRINTSSFLQVGKIIAKDSSKVFARVPGEYSSIYYTSNSGQTWDLKLSVDSTYHIFDYGFSRTNSNYAFSVSYSIDSLLGKFHKSSDGGMTWVTQYLPVENYYLTDELTVTDPNHLWLGTVCSDNCNDAKYMYTTDGGLNWYFKNFTPPYITTTTVMNAPSMKLDNLFGFTMYESWYYYIYKTTNGGQNWSSPQLFTTGEGVLSPLVNIDSSAIWYCVTQNNILKTTNDGGNWFTMSVPPHDSDGFVDYQFIRRNNKIYGWAITGGGRIFKLVEQNPFGINTISNEVPKSFVLYQNYPNPFNPVTKIRFDIPTPLTPPEGGKLGFVSLKIYDVLGREVAVIVNEKLAPGTYDVEWDASSFPSGVYFCSMKAGDFSAVQKMILLK